MHAKEGRGGGTRTQKSLFIHTQWLPRRPAEETNTGKEKPAGLFLSRARVRSQPASSQILRRHIFWFCLLVAAVPQKQAWNDIRR